MRKLQIMDPVVEPPKAEGALAPLVDTIEGRAVLFRIQWSAFDVFMQRFRELLEERARPRAVTVLDLRYESKDYVAYADRRNKEKWARIFDDLAAKADWAVLGLAA